MPGTELHPFRRAQATGISKPSKKQNCSKSKRQVITFTAIINYSELQSRTAEDCLDISRQCTASFAPKRLSLHSLDRSPPPPQVVLFFDHINGNSSTQRNHEEAIRYCRSFGVEIASARTRLQSLLPSKEDVTRIADYASRWMTLYHGLYSLTYTFRTGYQLVATYGRMQNSDVDPVLLASYVLCLAVSLQQAPSDITIGSLSRNGYIAQVCDVVEEVIVRKNVLAGTVEGLEACMLFLMLAVGRDDLTMICLTLQKLVALADIMGLPRTSYEQESNQFSSKSDPYYQAKLKIWEAICATDRNFGMMLKLPAGTTSSVFPLHAFLWRETGDISHSYNYFLARICGMVIDIDKSYSNGDSEVESYKTVLAVDRALETLASQVPKAWLTSAVGKAPDLIVKFWHPYILSRAHLRPAMISKEQYRNSRDIVRSASFDAVRMFCGFRRSLSRGFFFCQVLDIQAFTSALLLLLLRDDTDRDICRQQDELMDQLVECFKIVSTNSASSFARKAVHSIFLLREFKHGHQTSSMTIHIPLLGNVRVEGHNESIELFKHVTHDSFPDESSTPIAKEPLDSPTKSPSITANKIFFTIDFENDSPWTPPASRAGVYGRD